MTISMGNPETAASDSDKNSFGVKKDEENMGVELDPVVTTSRGQVTGMICWSVANIRMTLIRVRNFQSTRRRNTRS